MAHNYVVCYSLIAILEYVSDEPNTTYYGYVNLLHCTCGWQLSIRRKGGWIMSSFRIHNELHYFQKTKHFHEVGVALAWGWIRKFGVAFGTPLFISLLGNHTSLEQNI